jgi:hypothetical protein
MKVLLENIFAGRLGLTCDQPAEDINDMRRVEKYKQLPNTVCPGDSWEKYQ